MILIENQNLLMKQFPHVWKFVRMIDETTIDPSIQLLEAKSGDLTLAIADGTKDVSLHSKYNPKQEAERWIEQYKDVDHYSHIFFYGVGLGYHVEQFNKRYPEKSFTLFEPVPHIFYRYLEHKPLKDLPVKQLKNIYVEATMDGTEAAIKHFFDMLKEDEEVLFVPLPSYERAYEDKYKSFMKSFQKILALRKNHFQAHWFFDKRWTVNAIANFPNTAVTPNIFYLKDNFFRGKPAIIAAAGPSLADDMELLRQIRNENTAYIFAVGSAINSLIAHDIYPHAIISFDPSTLNRNVFDTIITKNITSIPLIYGTTIGQEVLREYPGPKVHVFVNQDSVSPFFLKRPNHEKIEFVNDSPSVAILAVQLLTKLRCDPIILAGQNLAYLHDRKYAAGINYSHISSDVVASDIENSVMVKDVYGNEVRSNPNMVLMKNQMESMIRLCSGIVEIINTTKGGAMIEGAVFKNLEDVMAEKLNKAVADADFHLHPEGGYEINHMINQANFLVDEYNDFLDIVDQTAKMLVEMNTMAGKVGFSDNQYSQTFARFDKQFKKVEKNKFYEIAILPMNRIQYELLLKQVAGYRFERDNRKKMGKMVEAFGKYITGCRTDTQRMQAIVIGLRNCVYQIRNKTSEAAN